MTDPRHRQRHDIPWSQPLPLEPRTLADDPLPAVPECESRHHDGAIFNKGNCPRCGGDRLKQIGPEDSQPEPHTSEPYKPKVGERARLVVTPRRYNANHAPCGSTWDITAVDAADEHYRYRGVKSADGFILWFPENTQWGPVAAQEPTAEPAQPEAEASEPIAVLRFLRRHPDPTVRAALDTLERDRAAHAAEVERLRGELESLRTHLDEARVMRDEERRKAEMHWNAYCGATARHGSAQARERVAHDQRERAEAELAAARAERPEPIARALCVYHACLGWEKDGDGSCHFCSFESERHDEDCVMVDPVCDDDTCLCRALGVRREGPTLIRRHPDEAPTHGEAAQRTEMLFCFAYNDDTPHGHLAVGFRYEDGSWSTEGDSEPIEHRCVRWFVPTHELLAPGALFGAEPKGQQDSAGTPGPRSSLENTGASATGGAGSNPDGGRPAETTDPLAGMPTPWRERIQEAEASISLLDRTLESLNNETEARLSALERAVEGLKDPPLGD